MSTPFVKMEGCGNNYIFFDWRKDGAKGRDMGQIARQVSDVNFGIGSDGAVFLTKEDQNFCTMHMYNLDGSEGRICGNALRCIGRLFEEESTDIRVGTRAGTKRVIKRGEHLFEVRLGTPKFQSEILPASAPILGQYLQIGNWRLRVCAVDMGNPHLVVLVPSAAKVNVKKVGKYFENSLGFPFGANTEFVNIISREEVNMRVYERGSGETLACGSGACAGVVAATKMGLLTQGRKITVHMAGGDLYVTYKNDGVTLAGDARETCRGEVNL